MMRKIPFAKMEGAGNDFVLIDTIHHRLDFLRGRWPSVAKALCDRRNGVGADGLLVLGRSRTADVRMRIFNPDGSEPSMCGNGVRCLVLYASRHDASRTKLSIETRAGIKRAEVLGTDRVKVDMGVPRLLDCIPRLKLDARTYGRADFIHSGVPHLVCWVDHVARVDLEKLGRRLRDHRRFKPQGTNVDFVEYVDSCDGYDRRLGVVVRHYRLRMRTYERGVEGETRACGTGAVAAAVSVARSFPFGGGGRQSPMERFEVSVRTPGGILRVSLEANALYDNDDYVFGHAFLEGPVRQVSQDTFMWRGRGLHDI